jgi:DnaJ family protein C protein 28
MTDSPREDRDEKKDKQPLNRAARRNFDALIDQHIRAAEEAGQFDNLSGAGKPLDLDDDDRVPEELRAGFRMLKNAGYAPPWIELQKSIADEQQRLETWLAQANRRWPSLGPTDREHLRVEYAERLRDLNKQITTYNLIAPPAAGQMPLLQAWRELRKLGDS